MSHRHVVAFSTFLILIAACSAEGTGVDLTPEPTVEDPSASLPPPSGTGGGATAPATDAGTTKPKADGSAPVVTPNAPAEGDSCMKVDEIYKKSCGACGVQEALCQFGSEDAGAGVVSNYSVCHDEMGSCEPGVVATVACGNCGTQVKTCSKYCAWSATTCAGEPVNSCPAGTVAWTTAGCPQMGTFRARACGDACSWGGYAGSCSAPDFKLTVAGTVGATSQIILPLGAGIKGKRVTGACATGATVSTDGDHAVAYVRVTNNASKKATLSVYSAQAPGGPVLDTSLAAYAAQPTNDEALKACEKGTGESCATANLPCGDYKFGSLTGAEAVVIPAGQSRVIAIATAAPFGTVGQITEGPVVLGVRTDVLE
jgi:hypothetical protein